MSESEETQRAADLPLPPEQMTPVAPPVPLEPPPPPGHTPVLQKLSSPPFPRSGFPLLGILASAYEHVTEVAARTRSGAVPPQASSSDDQRAA